MGGAGRPLARIPRPRAPLARGVCVDAEARAACLWAAHLSGQALNITVTSYAGKMNFYLSAVDDLMRREVDLFALCFSTEDKDEGVSAFLEKRKPAFKGK